MVDKSKQKEISSDPIFKEIAQAAKNGTLTFDELIAAARQSEAVAKEFDRFFGKNIHNGHGRVEQIRNLVLNGLDPSAPWTDFAPELTSTKHGLDALAAIKTRPATSRIGLFGSKTGAAVQTGASKEDKQEQDQGPKSTPSSFKRD